MRLCALAGENYRARLTKGTTVHEFAQPERPHGHDRPSGPSSGADAFVQLRTNAPLISEDVLYSIPEAQAKCEQALRRDEQIVVLTTTHPPLP